MVRIIKTDHGKFTDLTDSEGNVIETAEKVYEGYLKQLESSAKITEYKTLEELTKENYQLWDTVNLLLKKTGMIE